MITLCTLFDRNYLDKGLVLIDSLDKSTKDYLLYVLAMDKECGEVLAKEANPHIKLISIEDIIKYEPRLSELKAKRGAAEFCWTCTAVICEYILKEYGEQSVTYIDADMYFYDDASILLDELKVRYEKCCVGIMEHRFPRGTYYRLLERNSGKYCVEFNTFENCEAALKVLAEWKEQCLMACNAISSDEVFGDQKYLVTWPSKYGDVIGIHKSANGGIAPWNIKNYSLKGTTLMYKKYVLVRRVFYHFAGLEYIDAKTINLHVGNFDREVTEYFYKPYIEAIEHKRDYLNANYKIDLRTSVKRTIAVTNDESRDAFKDEMVYLLKRCRIVTVAVKVIRRFIISRYARKHFGTEADIFHIS